MSGANTAYPTSMQLGRNAKQKPVHSTRLPLHLSWHFLLPPALVVGLGAELYRFLSFDSTANSLRSYSAKANEFDQFEFRECKLIYRCSASQQKTGDWEVFPGSGLAHTTGACRRTIPPMWGPDFKNGGVSVSWRCPSFPEQNQPLDAFLLT